MPISLTKAELNKILVAERLKSRTKSRQSAFMNRTRGIYSGQTNRLRESLHDEKALLPYTLDELRQAIATALKGLCCYCGCKLTVKNVTPDHAISLVNGGSWNLDNLVYGCA
jgi:5-methylcytosine-specific restriction endonuclease McrA